MKTIMTGEVLAYEKHCILCKLILNIHILKLKLFLTLLVIRGVAVSYYTRYTSVGQFLPHAKYRTVHALSRHLHAILIFITLYYTSSAFMQMY